MASTGQLGAGKSALGTIELGGVAGVFIVEGGEGEGRTELTVAWVTRKEPATPPPAQETDPVDGLQFLNDGSVVIEVTASGGPTVVKFPFAFKVDGQTVNPLTVEVPNGSTKVVGPLPPYFYNVGRMAMVDCADSNGLLRLYHVDIGS